MIVTDHVRKTFHFFSLYYVEVPILMDSVSNPANDVRVPDPIISMIHRVRQSNTFMTSFPNSHLYSTLVFGYTPLKVCICISPRSACTVTMKCFFDMVGLLQDAIDYSTWIHEYRIEIF